MSETSPPKHPARARLQLLLLMLIPIGVVLAATFVFYTRIGLPEGTKNKGILVSPPIQMRVLSLRDENGKNFVIDREKDQIWTFLQVVSNNCDELCQESVWEVRQTRIALGKYQGHIQRVLLIKGGVLGDNLKAWKKNEHADAELAYVDEKDWQDFIIQSGVVDENQARFYLVDPRGFLMMYYGTEDNYKDVIADMKFLLKGVE